MESFGLGFAQAAGFSDGDDGDRSGRDTCDHAIRDDS